MRKISPADVRDDFRRQLAEISTFHGKSFTALPGDADRSTLAEQILLSAAVAWEGFVSDMFIAYINRDSSRFKSHLEDSLVQHLSKSSTPKRVYENFCTLSFPSHLSKADVESLANGTGSNITFPSFDDLEDRASTWLVAAHAGKFRGLTARQKAIVNSVVALRNHIAHRSRRSSDAMNEALAVGALHPTGIRRLGNRVQNVGAWLKSVPAGRHEPRLVTIIAELDGVGAAF